MITEQTAEAIASHCRRLAAAEYCLKNIGKLKKAVLEVTTEWLAPIPEYCPGENAVEEFNIGPDCLGQILRDVIDSHKARLDELNFLAVQEAQNE